MAGSERIRRIRKSNRTWDSGWVPALAGVAGGSLSALTVASLQDAIQGLAAFPGGSGAAPVYAFFFGFLALGVPILLAQNVYHRIYREMRALINVRPFTGSRLLSKDLWAMEAVFAEQFMSLIDEGPEQVVELGSGHSTVLMAQRLEERGSGHITSFDNMEEFAGRTREWIRSLGLEHRATVVHAPIVEFEVEGRRGPWYDPEVVAAAAPERIDLLIVDGPWGKLAPQARWPAVPVLRDRLAPGAVIHMDDGDRKDETKIAFDWGERLGARVRYVPGGRGGWLIRRKPVAEAE